METIIFVLYVIIIAALLVVLWSLYNIIKNSNNNIISFSDAFANYFAKCVDFKGVATRAEYWWIVLFFAPINIFLKLLDYEQMPDWLLFSLYVFILFNFIPSISLKVRRMHDIGKSGWELFKSIVIGMGILLFGFYFLRSLNDFFVWCCMLVSGWFCFIRPVTWFVTPSKIINNKYKQHQNNKNSVTVEEK